MKYSCPKCHKTEAITLTVLVTAKLVQYKESGEDEFETELEDSSHEWDEFSPMSCGCGFSGLAKMFEET